MIKFVHSKKSRISQDAKSSAGFRYVINALTSGKNLSGKVEIYHDDACGRCRRPLTTPASVSTGLGPICAGKLGVPHVAGEGANPFNALAYMTAGKAFVTFKSVKTGTHFTYRVRLADDRGNGAPRPCFVDLLTGSSNEADYTFMGLLWGVPQPKSDDQQGDLFDQVEVAKLAAVLSVEAPTSAGDLPRAIRDAGIAAEVAQAALEADSVRVNDAPRLGTWAATARIMAQGDTSGFDWDAWKDERKEAAMGI